jgi:hypothetical protein
MSTDDEISLLAELLDCDRGAVVPIALRMLAAHLHLYRCRFVFRRVPIELLRRQARPSDRVARIVRAYQTWSSGLGLEPPPIHTALGAVSDGNHRIAAARCLGFSAIDVFEMRHERPERDPRREVRP